MPKLEDGSFIARPNQAARYLNGSAMPGILTDAQAILVGKKVKAVGYIINGGEPFPFIEFEDGSAVTVQRDDEGNGPGVLFVSDGNAVRMTTLCETQLK